MSEPQVSEDIAALQKVEQPAPEPITPSAPPITEAGLVGQIAHATNPTLVESIKKKLLISLEKHHSKGIIVHGHQECAGNPVPVGTAVIPVFVVKNKDWEAVELKT